MKIYFTPPKKVDSCSDVKLYLDFFVFVLCLWREQNRTKQNNPQLNCLQSPCDDDKWYLFSELLGAHLSPATTAAAHLQHADANCPLFKRRLTSGFVSPRARLICSAHTRPAWCVSSGVSRWQSRRRVPRLGRSRRRQARFSRYRTS